MPEPERLQDHMGAPGGRLQRNRKTLADRRRSRFLRPNLSDRVPERALALQFCSGIEVESGQPRTANDRHLTRNEIRGTREQAYAVSRMCRYCHPPSRCLRVFKRLPSACLFQAITAFPRSSNPTPRETHPYALLTFGLKNALNHASRGKRSTSPKLNIRHDIAPYDSPQNLSESSPTW